MKLQLGLTNWSTKPNFLNRFVKKPTRERVVPTISQESPDRFWELLSRAHLPFRNEQARAESELVSFRWN
jgi:hypothetical protein